MKERIVEEVKRGIAVLSETLQCPICLDLLAEPVSTKCDHQFCKFCMMKLLESNKQRRAACPVCKTKVTKRSLQESAAFWRLVTGLQDMIRAYEKDTGLNYFDGLSQNKELSSVRTWSEVESEQCQISAGRTDQHEVVRDDVTRSPSSTVAAQNGFALVMGFEDDSPASVPDGLDSGLGGVLQSPAIIPDDSKSNEELIKIKETEEGNQIAVSYLTTGLKVIHSECETEAAAVIMSGQLDGRPRRRSARMKQTKKPEQVLEQKQKKSMEKVAEWLMNVPAEGVLVMDKSTEEADETDSSTSTLDIKLYNVEVSPTNKEVQAKVLEEQVFGAVYKRRRRANRFSFPLPKTRTSSGPESITKLERFSGASESVRNCHNVEANEQLENDTCSHVERAASETGEDETENIHQRLVVDDFPESEAHTCHDEDRDSHQPQRLSKRKHSTLQEFDSNSTLPKRVGSCLLKKKDKRRGKGVQVSKPLVLGRINYQETIPKTNVQAEAVQIHIENYPSSEETAMRTTPRRSGRFRFNEALGDKNAQPEESTRRSSKVDKAKPQDKPLSILLNDQKNGCVCDDLGGIENMDEKEAATPLADENPVSAVTVHQPEGNSVHVSETVETLNKSEEDRNDSEIDTEQLVKSFKSTKRKSFHLGGPSEKRRRNVGENHVLMNDSVESDATSSNSKCVSQSSVRDVDNSNCSALIPPSNIEAEDGQVQPSGLVCSPEVASRSSLSPNKVVEHGSREPLSQDASESIQNAASPDIVKEVQNDLSQETRAGLLNVDTLTPDGLDASHDSVGTNRLSQSPGVHPANQNQPWKRKEPLKLESPSGSEECDSDLPTLAQILEVSADSHDGIDRKQGAERAGVDAEEQLCLPPTCSSPDYVQSSQASVDLFDPPAVAEALCHHNSVSMESSQFSSDVLITQQKMEMQKDLVRLEKLIGLVTEVLQEKQEDHPTFSRVGALCEGHLVNGSDGMSSKGCLFADRSPEKAVDTKRRHNPENVPRDGEAVKQTSASLSTSAAEMAVQPSNAPELNGTVTSLKVPRSPATPKTAKKSISFSEDMGGTRVKDGQKVKMTLVSSGLGPLEQKMVKRFAKQVNACVVSRVTPDVTHVIMCTDEQLVCERTLKYFLGISSRKWVVSFHWISECFRQKKFLDERNFEVKGDVVNGHNHLGPMRARTSDESHLLMKGYRVCFQGPFTDMTVDEMEWMVEQCGAAVVKDPLLFKTSQPKSVQLIIVQSRPESWLSTHRSLCTRASVVTRAWLLDSVATYTLQDLSSYTR